MLVELEVVVVPVVVADGTQLLTATINASNAAIIPKLSIFVFCKLCLLNLILCLVMTRDW